MAGTAAGAETSRSGGSADSYIGSLISLTSKYEIRYEGVLHNINTEESSIGLRNVRSFGTEGRKKDGPQIPPGDKVYEYILFRGSDIKDLQVKSSTPVQAPAPIHNDPAIIQSHYSRPPSISTSLPPSASGSSTDPNPHPTQMGLPRPPFQGGMPLYPPVGSLGPWGSAPPPPPNASGNGLAVPMYWQGFYGPSSGIPPMHQQSLFRPPPHLSGNPVQQPMQYPGVNPSFTTVASNVAPLSFPSSNLPASNFPSSNLQSNMFASKLPPSPLLPPVSSGDSSSTSSTLPSTLPPTLVPSHSVSLASEAPQVMMPNRAPAAAISTAMLIGSLPLVSPLATSSVDINTVTPPIPIKPKNITGSSLPYQTISQPASTVGTSSSSHIEGSVPSLVTPGQLLQPTSAAISSSQTSQPAHKDVEVVQAPPQSERPPSPPKEVQAPLLPLPSAPDRKLNGPSLHTRGNHGYRGRARGRGNGILRPVNQFMEEFDFIAMNEKFKKDEVWGHLGKSNIDKVGGGEETVEDYSHEEDDVGSSNIESKPVYVKDDFFDSLSCNSLDHGSRNGRPKFSEQMKIDTETFGEFPRHRGGQGGRGPGRGSRSRGPYHGSGYGYAPRGRGQPMPNRGN